MDKNSVAGLGNQRVKCNQSVCYASDNKISTVILK